MRYIIIPKGFSINNIDPSALEILHRNGANDENAEIVAIRGDRELFRISYTKSLARKLGASIVPISVRTPEGTEVLGEQLPFFRSGAPPIIQLFIKKCHGLNQNEVFKVVFDELQILPKNPKFRKWVKEMLKYSVRAGYLVEVRERFFTGPDTPELGREGYDAERGIYPVERLIYDLCSDYGKVSIAEIADTVHNKWKWVTNRWAVDFWVREMLRAGYLKKVGKDYEIGKILVGS